jgi:hypothetical protein
MESAIAKLNGHRAFLDQRPVTIFGGGFEAVGLEPPQANLQRQRWRPFM